MSSAAVASPSTYQHALPADHHRHSTSSALSSSQSSYRTAPLPSPLSNSSSTPTLSPSPTTAMQTLTSKEIHVVTVTDPIEFETGQQQQQLQHPSSSSSSAHKHMLHPDDLLSSAKVGPPPPSPPASLQQMEDEQLGGVAGAARNLNTSEPDQEEYDPSSQDVIYDEPESIAAPVPQRGPSIDGYTERASTDTKNTMSTVRAYTSMYLPSSPSSASATFSTGATTIQRTSEDNADASSLPSKTILVSSPDGHLLPPSASSALPSRPTRRNTTGSTPRLSPPPGTSASHRPSVVHPRFSSQAFAYEEGDAEGEKLASDIEAEAERIRRERQQKRAKQQQEAEAALTRPQTQTKEDDKPLVGNLIGEDHVNYVLMYNMLTGIRIGVSRCQAKIKRPLTPEDFKAAHKFTFDIIGNELTPSAKYDFKFKDYASWVFRELREDYFHLDPADYLLSLTAKYILSELGSPGKSGSFFYFSRDYRFIIKTIRHSEAKFLLSILPQYYEHVKSNPHTLLSRFYGLHRVKLPHGRKIHFVIMNNLFPPHRDIHETYDLKGSTVGREYPEDKARENPRAVLKDLNWINRGKMLEIGPEKRALLTEQLRRDAEFLKKVQVMDYSLLIGIHNMQRGNRDNVRKNTLKVFSPDIPGPVVRRNTQFKGSSPEAIAMRKAMRESDPKRLGKRTIRLPEQDTGDRQHFIFYQDEGGLRATDELNEALETIYYLGVIDILTPYNTLKKIEHLWKGLQADIHKISPVPPGEYGDRFFAFMKAIMRGGEGGARFKSE